MKFEVYDVDKIQIDGDEPEVEFIGEVETDLSDLLE